MHINKVYINKKQSKSMKMKENEAFNLDHLLYSLTHTAQPYTQITIISFSLNLLHFIVAKPLISKKKTYKIICTEDQALDQLKKLIQGLLLFPVRKIMVTLNYFDENNCANDMLLKQFKKYCFSVSFEEIIIQQEVKQPQKILRCILQNFDVVKISFLHHFHLIQIGKLISWLHQQLLQKNIILYFQISEVSQKDLVYFTEQWINSLPSKYDQQTIQKKFGYPFPLIHKKCNFIGRREQICLCIEDRVLVTVRQLQQQGRSFVVSYQISMNLLDSLIETLFNKNKGVCFEILPVPSTNLVILAEKVSQNFTNGYRFVVGHQLQLSAHRLILNTLELNMDEVVRMMRLGLCQGRYQIVLYSQIKYLQVALALYFSKPIIKFNIFMPLDQLTPEISNILKKIDKQCHITKLSAYSLAALLNRYGQFGYVVVNSLFNALSDDP